MQSLYRRYPVGSLLVWVTETENADARGSQELQSGTVKLLLDGQQRITSLYGLIRGRAPKFFDGDAKAFSGLYFNIESEVFEFYAPTKMKDDARWLSVTEVLCDGAGATLAKLMKVPELAEQIDLYLNRVTAIANIKEIDLHIEEVVGADKTIDVVVDIFNKVNSGGTKLSKGDLTLARICAQWPEARDEMKLRLKKWEKAGYKFTLDWLLRGVNTVTTGEALFTAMKDVTPAGFKSGLETSEKLIDRSLNRIASRLGLDHDRVLGSRFAIPLMIRYESQRGGKLVDQSERDRLLYWYIHTLLWGRYSASTESVLNKDLEAIESANATGENGALDQLIEKLRENRGDLRLKESDFAGSTKGNRFYPLLYMMTRARHARDWGTGDELNNHLLGHLTRLEIHHVFPKALLYEAGIKKREVNAIANFTFLTQETNLEVSKRDPAEYLPHYEQKNPGSIATHWLPMDPELWKVENYFDFLAERRKLLANAANEFLEKLANGHVPEPEAGDQTDFVAQASVYIPGSIDSDEEEARLTQCRDWVVSQGLPEGQIEFELTNEAGDQVAFLDLAWPDGLQPGLTQPVAVLINEPDEVHDSASNAGYRCFSSPDSFQRYVLAEILHHDAVSSDIAVASAE
ncbi:protein containing DUF262 [Rhodopirellula sallentina SM41]|uniref:Protein containing DUF262 n=1 Tax=Rhodopirellula sallentina SM41 TaxID=1263870 RepID=M5U489_9BACT|nr:protein containing DUF262 [Rhodopirellula sallentina SM41]